MRSEFASAIYEGTLRHRRFSPKKHEFSYKVFMVYLDLTELDSIFSQSPFWSLKRWAPIQFKRSDFHVSATDLDLNKSTKSDHNLKSLDSNLKSLDSAVRDTVENKTGVRLTGPIRMLANLRYWGYVANPLTTYYCFDENGENVVAILAEVHNTPWNERHAYVLTGDNFEKRQACTFEKSFHVSPFNPIDMRYHWLSTSPQKTLAIHLENWEQDAKIMDATLTLSRREMNKANMNQILIRFPWMTVKVIAAIYWQALQLLIKRIPIFGHPNREHFEN
jgi:uncharacterized protein